jgi:hypothetical protein
MRFARTASSFVIVLALAPPPPFHEARQGAPVRQPAPAARIDVPYADAKPIIETLREDLVPLKLRNNPAAREATWPTWVTQHDQAIRARLERGDEDSIVNLLLFGVTFTRLARITEKDAPPPGQSGGLLDSALVQGRLDDLVTAIAAPGTNDRLRFARAVAERNGFDPASAAGRAGLRRRLSDDLRRVLAENDAYTRTKLAGSAPGDPGGAVQESTFFRDRGLSSDTSIFPDVAIDQALGALKANGILRPDAVRRVAIIGPGLDFADKRDGHDFYPQQTLQPFAVVDSLRRLGLAAAARPAVLTFDLSARVNQHLQAARARARAGEPYLLNVPRDAAARWNPELVSYWERFGDRIGDPAVGAAPAAAGAVAVRSVRVRPDVVASIEPQDLNIVLQRLDLPAGGRFDLIVATNVLVYYDVFDQCLALANITRMLEPGGVFLSNTDVPTLPHLPITRIGYTELAYTDQANAADRLLWLQRSHE